MRDIKLFQRSRVDYKDTRPRLRHCPLDTLGPILTVRVVYNFNFNFTEMAHERGLVLPAKI